MNGVHFITPSAQSRPPQFNTQREPHDMSILILGLVLFLGLHSLPHFSGARAALLARFGEGAYKGGFALVALIGFGLIVWGKSQAPYVHVWTPPMWGRHATMTLMLLSTVALSAIYLPTNLKRWTAHPMLWGVALWAAAHLLVNGDLASLLLFSGFFVFSLFDVWSANARGALPKKEKVSGAKDALVFVVALLLYGFLLWLHPHAFGVSVLRMS